MRALTVLVATTALLIGFGAPVSYAYVPVPLETNVAIVEQPPPILPTYPKPERGKPRPTPAPTPAPTPTPLSIMSPIPVATPVYGSSYPWDQIVACEAGGNWGLVTTGNGFYFALQFTPGTWLANGGTQAELSAGVAPSRARIIQVGQNVLRSQGPGAWPNCFP